MARATARALLFAAVLVTAGCDGLYGSAGPTSDQRAVEAVSQAHQASLDVTSYRYTVDGQITVRQDSRSRSVTIAGRGIVDVEAQRANVTVRTRGDIEAGQRETRAAYLDGYTLDIACARLGWARHNLSESPRWLNYSALGQQLALLDRATVHWNGTEVVDCEEAAVVTAHPTEKQLRSKHPLPPGSQVTSGGAELQNATVRAWIDTETGHVRKVQREVHVRTGETTGSATVTFRFTGFNEPTAVTRPSFEEYGHQWSDDCVDA